MTVWASSNQYCFYCRMWSYMLKLARVQLTSIDLLWILCGSLCSRFLNPSCKGQLLFGLVLLKKLNIQFNVQSFPVTLNRAQSHPAQLILPVSFLTYCVKYNQKPHCFICSIRLCGKRSCLCLRG